MTTITTPIQPAYEYIAPIPLNAHEVVLVHVSSFLNIIPRYFNLIFMTLPIVALSQNFNLNSVTTTNDTW